MALAAQGYSQATGPGNVVTYDPAFTEVKIDGDSYVHINSIEATPLDDERYTTEKATTGERAWIHTPEWGAEVTIEFSGGLPGWARQTIRNMMGYEKFEVIIQDKSETHDGVILENARLVQKPDFSRDDSEPTYEAVFESPFVQWTSHNAMDSPDNYGTTD